MNRIQVLITVYTIACLLLALIYRYYTDVFLPKVLGYNLALWYALLPNLLLLVVGILLFKQGKKMLSILPIILIPASVYLFYSSWVNISYVFLAEFLLIPILLLSFSLYMSWKR